MDRGSGVRMRSQAERALLTLFAVCCVAVQLSGCAAHDTSGYAPANGGSTAAVGADNLPLVGVRVGDGVPGIRCAENAVDLAPLLAATLEPDIAAWQRSSDSATAAPYTIADWEALVRGGADRFGGERLVLIYNNSWYYFKHVQVSAVATPRGATPETTVPFVTSWVTATQWWFEEAVSAWNMTFPGAPQSRCMLHEQS